MAKELKIRITGDSSGLQDGADDGMKILKGFGSKVSAWGVASGELLASGIKSGLETLGGMLQQGIASAMEAEASSDKLAARLGIFNPEMQKELGEVAGRLYGNAYGESIGDVNDAIGRVFADGLVPEDVTNEQLESITGKVMDLATAFDQDLGAVTRGVSNLMRNDLAPDAESALDIVTRGFQQGADKSEDFMDTLNEYSVQFKKLGIDGATATGLLVQGLNAGARDGDKVADAFKEFSIRAINGSTLTAESFQALGFDADEMAQRIGAGGESARAGLDEVLDGLKNIEDPVKRAQIAVGLFGTQSEDLGDALWALDLDTAAKGLGHIAGAAERTGQILNDNTRTKIEAFKRQALQGMADVAERYVIPAFEDLFAWGQKVADLFKSGGWQAALGEVGGKLTQAWLAASDWLYTTALPAIGRFLVEVGKKFGTWVTETAVPYLAENLPIWLDTFTSWYNSTAAPWLRDRMIDAAKKLGEWIADAAIYLKDNLPGWIASFADWYYGTALPWLAEKTSELAQKFGDWVDDAAVRLLEKLPGWIGSFTEWFVGTALPWLTDKTAELQSKMVDWVADAAVDLAAKLPEWLNAFKNWATNEALPGMVSFGKDILRKLGEGVVGANSLLFDTGVQVVAGLIRGLESMGGELAAAARNVVASNIPGPVRDLLGISSPSKVFHEIGVQTAQGLAGGMLAGSGLVQSAATRMAGAAITSPRLPGYTPVELSGGQAAAGGWQQQQLLAVVQLDGRTFVNATNRPAEFERRAGQ